MIDVALYLIVTFLAIQLVLLIYLLIKKTIDLSIEKVITTAYDRLMNDTIAYMTEESVEEPSWPSSAKVRYAVIERLLKELSTTSKNESELARLSVLAKTHLAPTYRRVLQGRKWARRVNALYFIEDLLMYSLRDDVWERLVKSRKNDEEYRQALRTLASLQDERVVTFLVEAESLPRNLIGDVFRRLPVSAMELLKEQIEAGLPVSEELIHSFISYSGENNLYQFLPYIENNLTSADKEIRIKSLRSLCYYQYHSEPEKLREFFRSSFWEERMFVARLSGIMLLTQYTSQLTELAGDPVWWVRYSACEALKKMPDGEIFLEFIATEHEDAFARDMAKQSMTLGGARRSG